MKKAEERKINYSVSLQHIMALIPINIKEGTLKKEELIIGIDLGTTNSLVAIIDKETKQAKTLSGKEREVIVPSVIYINRNKEIEVGNEAKPYLISDPVNTIFSVKRLMGRSYKDLENEKHLHSYKILDDSTERLIKIQVGDTFYTPVELSSFILKELKYRAEKDLNSTISKAVITVPAYFNDSQRQATRDAGKLAGLDVLRIVNEPTAASLAYGIGLNPEESKTIAVYDLGGGTFDLSILRIENGIFEVLSTHGDTRLGGDDMDKFIVEKWQKDHPSLNEDELSRSDLQTLRLKAELAKRSLTLKESYRETVVIHDQKFDLEITRSEFEILIKDLIQKTIDSCKQAMKDAGLNNDQIDEIVMVGGSTRIPYVKNTVKTFFGKETLHDKLNPDEVVAMGAAIEADILAGNRKDILLLDVTPLSLGIETLGGLMDVIIPRNSKVPNKAGRQYTTSRDGQSDLRISIYQGERDDVKHNRLLGSFHLKGIPAMPAGLPKVEISFMLDADGILKVSACELRSGVEQHIEVKPQYGLNDEELEKMLLDSLQNASADMNFRALKEAKTDSEQLIYSTERFIDKNADFLSNEEILESRKIIEKLISVIDKGTKDEILNVHEELNDYTRPFAERLMDKAISNAIKGKSLGDVG